MAMRECTKLSIYRSLLIWLCLFALLLQCSVGDISYISNVSYSRAEQNGSTIIKFTTPSQFLTSKISTFLYGKDGCRISFMNVLPTKGKTFTKKEEVYAVHREINCNGEFTFQMIPSSRYYDEKGLITYPCDDGRLAESSSCPEDLQSFWFHLDKSFKNCTPNDVRRLCSKPFYPTQPPEFKFTTKAKEARSTAATTTVKTTPILRTKLESGVNVEPPASKSMKGRDTGSTGGGNMNTILIIVGSVLSVLIVIGLLAYFLIKHGCRLTKPNSHMENRYVDNVPNVLEDQRRLRAELIPPFDDRGGDNEYV